MILYTPGDGEGVGREVADNKFYVFRYRHAGFAVPGFFALGNPKKDSSYAQYVFSVCRLDFACHSPLQGEYMLCFWWALVSLQAFLCHQGEAEDNSVDRNKCKLWSSSLMASK